MIVHASSIVHSGRGLLIEGPSGAGKSALALALMAYGAQLVADDRTKLMPPGEGRSALHGGTSGEEHGAGGDLPMLDAPSSLPHLIEARGVGLIPARLAGPVPLSLIVDLAHAETARLPQPRHRTVFGCKIALLHRSGNVQFAAAVLQYLKSMGDR